MSRPTSIARKKGTSESQEASLSSSVKTMEMENQAMRIVVLTKFFMLRSLLGGGTVAQETQQ